MTQIDRGAESNVAAEAPETAEPGATRSPESTPHTLAAERAHLAAEALRAETSESFAGAEARPRTIWYEMHLGNGRFLRTHEGFDERTVRRLLSLLQADLSHETRMFSAESSVSAEAAGFGLGRGGPERRAAAELTSEQRGLEATAELTSERTGATAELTSEQRRPAVTAELTSEQRGSAVTAEPSIARGGAAETAEASSEQRGPGTTAEASSERTGGAEPSPSAERR